MSGSVRIPSASEVSIPAGHALRRTPIVLLALGVVALGGALALGGGEKQFYFSWLTAYMFWLSIGLGALFFVLTHHATRAKWSVVVRRVAENFMVPLVGAALLFIPIFTGRHHLFHWMEPGVMDHDEILQSKAWWLSEGFWQVRVAIYMVVWAALAWWFRSRSIAQDTASDPGLTKRLIRLSAPGLMLFALSTSAAAIDWIMSLDPHWYSTMFGVYYFAGAFVGFLALFSLVTTRLRGSLAPAITVEHQHDLGKMLFAFTVFWAYIGFSQYFLIWYGNIPEETVFYAHRTHGAWNGLTHMLVWGHFLVPFFFLMSRNIKRRRPLLIVGSVWMLLMHYADLYWLIMPVLHEHTVHVHALDLMTLVGMGCLFVGTVQYFMGRAPLIPLGDPRLPRSLAFENF